MICPKCKSKDFKPSNEFPRPLFNLGKKEKFATVDIRRWMCVICGYRFKTKEEFLEPISVKNHQDLFEHGH